MVEEKDMLKFGLFASSAHCIRFICKNKYLLLLIFAKLFNLRLESLYLEDMKRLESTYLMSILWREQ